MSTSTSSRALAPIGAAGNLFAFALDVGRGLFRRPFQLREFIQQAWFIASVTIVPTALVAIPFGAVIALQVGGLIKQFGAQSFTGSASVLAVIQQAAPIGTALLIAGAGGSAIAADLGARKIREELDAMMVLGIDPIQRLVVPRVLACMLVAFFLNGMVSVVGVSRRLRLQRHPAGRHPRRVPRELHRAGAAAGPVDRADQGARLRPDRRGRGVLQGDERQAAGRRASATPSTSPSSSRSCCSSWPTSSSA